MNEIRKLLSEARDVIKGMYFGGSPHAGLLARIDAALAEPEQEPVAIVEKWDTITALVPLKVGMKLYTKPEAK